MALDRLERVNSPVDTAIVMFEGLQAGMWTALPGKVIGFDPATQTASVQPTIQMQVQAADGTFSWVQLPVLQLCPVHFPSGGGVTMTFPVAAGDECLVVFASRCIDGWWQDGSISPQVEMRMHDLSDGFVLVGFRSKPHVPSSISTTEAQLRSLDGTTKVGLNPTSGTVTITAANVVVNGNMAVNGNLGVTGTMQNNGVNVGGTHVHGGVQNGTGNTAVPH